MPEDTKLPYTHVSKELNDTITELMTDYKNFINKAKSYGFDVKFCADSTFTLELYFHDDYPNMLLVDKDISCQID